MLTWNGREDTLACLASLREASYPNARVLVVDNASADGTAEAVRREYPEAELLVNGVNLRFAGGNNAGMRYALGRGARYCLLLNNDTVVKGDFLDHLVDAAEADPAVGMAAPKIYFHGDPRRFWYAGGRVKWWQGWIEHVGVREEDRGQYDTPGRTGYVTGCCLLVRREVIDRLGMLDEAYFIYGEDADWSFRAARAGYALAYVPSAVVWHKVSVSTGGHLSWFKNWNKLKSQLRLMARYARPYQWCTIPFGIAWNVVASFVRVKAAGNRSTT